MGSISPPYISLVCDQTQLHMMTIQHPCGPIVVQFPQCPVSIGGVVTVAAAIRFHPHPPAVFKPISLSSVLGVGGGSSKGGREVGCQAVAWSKPTPLRNTFFDIWTSAGCGRVTLSNPEAGLYFKTYQHIWAHLCQLHAFHSAACISFCCTETCNYLKVSSPESQHQLNSYMPHQNLFDCAGEHMRHRTQSVSSYLT